VNLTTGLAVAVAVPHACAQCEWIPSEHPSDEIIGRVFASVIWDPDGAGPLGDHVVAAGDFGTAGSIPTGSVAKWDGHRWSGIASSPLTNGRIDALVVFEGDLVAAGRFNSRIARFDGSEWVDIGGGIGSGSNRVSSLAVYQGDLYAGGFFQTAGGAPASNIARWDGASWQPLGAGTNSPVESLVVFDGKLIAGGPFTSAGGLLTSFVATWDGQDWGPLADSPQRIYYSTVHNGELYIASNELVLRWNGSDWDQVGGLLRGLSSLSSVSSQLLIEANVGGFFDNVAYWNGSAWTPLGDPPTRGDVFSLTEFQSDLIALGDFGIAGEHVVRNAARWTGSTWRPLGVGFNSLFTDQLMFNGDLVVVGSFTAGPNSIGRGIAKWDGKDWSSFPAAPSAQLLSAVEFQGNLVACPVDARRVELWDGQTWQFLGSEFDDRVRQLAVHEDRLYVCGFFTSVGGETARGIARWDGAEWKSVGANANSLVYDLLSFGGDLYAGGSFTSIGGRSARFVARWDGIDWHEMPNTFTDRVFVLELHNNEVVAGGRFDPGRVARWDGSQWLPLGPGLAASSTDQVTFLSSHQGQLYAAGSFGTPAMLGGVARWDGTEWHPLAAGGVGSPNASSVGFYGNDVLVSGRLAKVNGLPTNNYAWVRCDTCYPDCDNNEALDIFDFLCFQDAFATTDPYADCDSNNVYDVFDFLCFQDAFVTGCL